MTDPPALAAPPPPPPAAPPEPAPSTGARRHDRLAGVLLGTALGDALGLPMEGMSAAVVARYFPRVDRFHLLGRRGFVSDDTEQSALMAQSLGRHAGAPDAIVRAFRRALLGWFLRLPWGIGWGTLRACARILVGVRESGVRTAGNGAAMRAAIVGAAYAEDAISRRLVGERLARVTHTDPRAVAGALFVGEVAAACACAPHAQLDARALVAEVGEPSLRSALELAVTLAEEGVDEGEAAARLGTSGFVLHSVPFATYAFLRGGTPLEVIQRAIAAGGDTDSNAAIAGAFAGALHGESGLPAALLEELHDGPFGPTHLRALAAHLTPTEAIADGSSRGERLATYSPTLALARNLALFPVVLVHAVRVVASRFV